MEPLMALDPFSSSETLECQVDWEPFSIAAGWQTQVVSV